MPYLARLSRTQYFWLIGTLIAAAGLNGAIDFDPDAILPVYDSNGDLTGFTGFGDDRPLVAATAFGEGWYAAFLTNDPDEPDPFHLNTVGLTRP